MEWLFISLALLAAMVFGVAYWTYRKAFYSPKSQEYDIFDIPLEEQYKQDKERMVSLIKDMAQTPYEEVCITSFDGTKLYGRYYHVSDEAPLHIQFHGYRGTAVRDFCGINKTARALGHNALTVDQRAHGKSGSETITFGIKERKDCLCWIEYACNRFGKQTEIYLSGISMGAATVIMASGEELPPNVKCVMADCPSSSPEAIICKVVKDMGYPSKLVMPLMRLGAKVFGKFDLRETTAVEAVKKAKIPILIIHGQDDLFVPCQMSEEIYLARQDLVTRKTFKKAGHGISYIVHTEEYEKTVIQFLNDL